MDWVAVATAVGGLGVGAILGALGTWWVGMRDVGLRRRVETIRVFLEVSGRAHGYAPDGTPIPRGQRVAAIYLMADLGTRDDWLRAAAMAQLHQERTKLRDEHAEVVAQVEAARKMADELAETDPHWEEYDDHPSLQALRKLTEQEKWLKSDAFRADDALTSVARSHRNARRRFGRVKRSHRGL